jgi:exodeoxyribonuclease VII large subunit
LFAASRKRPLPAYPSVIGLATSLSGAVLHDVRKVLARRWPMARVIVGACQVQGQGAAPTIVAALRRLSRWTDAGTGRGVDLLILARGGGSLEDLWPFNEEIVVRAVAASPCPIVVGVGHETDVTLAEFAADVRAATPSVAAELAVPARADELARLRNLRGRLDGAAGRQLRERRQRFDSERRALDGYRPGALLAAQREAVGLLLDRATRLIDVRLERRRAEVARAADRLPTLLSRRIGHGRAGVERAAAGLSALSPFATLERGYAIVRDGHGKVVRAADEVAIGDSLGVRLHRGRLDARVEAVQDSADD